MVHPQLQKKLCCPGIREAVWDSLDTIPAISDEVKLLERCAGLEAAGAPHALCSR